MKVKIYFDVFPWTEQSNLFFANNAQSLTGGKDATRYLIEVEIPDPGRPDKIIQAEAKEIEKERA